jgi:hypothetical protein
MADFDWKDLIRKLAPTVGAAVGGPLGAGILGGISQIILGRGDGSEADIASAMKAGALTGEQITQLKTLEMTLRNEEQERGFRYADLEFKTDQMYLADVQDARHRQIETKDNMPQIICAVAFVIYVLEFIFFASGHMPTDEFTKALITRAFGTVDGILLTCVAYFVGSSKGSKTSGDSMRRIAEVQAASTAKVAEVQAAK